MLLPQVEWYLVGLAPATFATGVGQRPYKRAAFLERKKVTAPPLRVGADIEICYVNLLMKGIG